MRTDIRAFHLEEFGSSRPGKQATSGPSPQPLLTEGVELAGSAASLDSGAYRSVAWSRSGRDRACSSAAWTRW